MEVQNPDRLGSGHPGRVSSVCGRGSLLWLETLMNNVGEHTLILVKHCGGIDYYCCCLEKLSSMSLPLSSSRLPISLHCLTSSKWRIYQSILSKVLEAQYWSFLEYLHLNRLLFIFIMELILLEIDSKKTMRKMLKMFGFLGGTSGKEPACQCRR